MKAIGDNDVTAAEIAKRIGDMSSIRVASQIKKRLIYTYVTICGTEPIQKNRPWRSINIYRLTPIGKSWVERHGDMYTND